MSLSLSQYSSDSIDSPAIDYSPKATGTVEATSNMLDEGMTATSPLTSSTGEATNSPYSRESLSITLKVEIAVGSLVVVIFVTSLALLIGVWIKIRAASQRSKSQGSLNIVERNNQLTIDYIQGNTNGSGTQSNQATLAPYYEDHLQDDSIYASPDSRYASQLIYNQAYRNSNLVASGLSQQEACSSVNLEQNPAYRSSQERLN